MKNFRNIFYCLLLLAGSTYGFSQGTVAYTNNPAITHGMKFQGTYSSGTTYALNDVVIASGAGYLSMVSSNVGHTPSSSPTQWQALGSASVEGSGASDGDAGTMQMAGSTSGTFAASHVKDDGTTVTSTEPFTAPSLATSDLVNNTQKTWYTGTSGDSTCAPATVAHSVVTCMKDGLLQESIADAFSNAFQPLAVEGAPHTLTDADTISWSTTGASLANAAITLDHTRSTRTVNVTGLREGSSAILALVQDSTGGATTLVLGTGCTWYLRNAAGGYIPGTSVSLTTSALAANLVGFTQIGGICYTNAW